MAGEQTRICIDARKVGNPLNGNETRCLSPKKCNFQHNQYCTDRNVVPPLLHLEDESKIPVNGKEEPKKQETFAVLTDTDYDKRGHGGC